MHLSTPRFQDTHWTHKTKNRYQNILHYVGKASFLLDNQRERTSPFRHNGGYFDIDFLFYASNVYLGNAVLRDASV